MKLTLPTIALLGALSFISGYLTIPVGPVPFTLQTAIVLLSGVILPPKEAAWSQVIHILLKFLTMGFSLVMLPSFGFLLSFPIIASLLSWYYRKHNRQSKYLIRGMILASIISYIMGLIYMRFILITVLGNTFTWQQIIQMGMLVFLPGDIIKGAVIYQLSNRMRRHVSN